MRPRPRALAPLLLVVSACGDDTRASASDSASVTLPATVSDPSTSTGAGSSGDTLTAGAPTTGGATGSATGSATGTTGPDVTTGEPGSTDATSTGGVKPDAGASSTGDTTTGLVPSCTVVDDMDGTGACEMKAPADSFDPMVQWSFLGPDGLIESIVTPLVANFTDDNGDGAIDLCDVPDVLVVAGTKGASDTAPAFIFILDGLTGAPHFKIATAVQYAGTPAIGDIDNDGFVEIVTTLPGGAAALVAFEHDGALKWQSATPWVEAQSSAVALADLDADGDVEIVAGTKIYDHNGVFLFGQPGDRVYSASTAADLDGDGDLEIVYAHGAAHHDGKVLYNLPQIDAQGGLAFYPQVANLDDDDDPEVLVAAQDALHVFEHTGVQKLQVSAPKPGSHGSGLPATVHDFDGDGVSEFAASSGNAYTVYKRDGTIVWSANVIDASGLAAGTAFDFLGDGVAEAMYADEHTMFIFDGAGKPLLTTPRLSGTVTEYPTVADIDNDGSAEILVVSNTLLVGGNVDFTVQAVRDKEDRWIQARRIWNQHTYHVTNIREDGTIPQHEPKHWQLLNTFRTNAQIEGGAVCKPPIPL